MVDRQVAIAEGDARGLPEGASWCWPATAPHVSTARREVVRFLEGACRVAPALADIALGVSEALTNVVVHAHRGGAPAGEMRVEVGFTATEIVVSVTDDGCGMTPRGDSPGLGLGLPVMAAVTDGLEIEQRPEGGTAMRLRFRRGVDVLDPAGCA